MLGPRLCLSRGECGGSGFLIEACTEGENSLESQGRLPGGGQLTIGSSLSSSWTIWCLHKLFVLSAHKQTSIVSTVRSNSDHTSVFDHHSMLLREQGHSDAWSLPS